MSYKKVLVNIFENIDKNINELQENSKNNAKIIAHNSFNQKGVFTVFVTLAIYKIVNPKQDIRKHQTQIKGGFSGRIIDTKYITPTLKELGLPSMAESGWLTRSLEQPEAYTLNYQGKISNKIVKKAFLELIDDIQEKDFNIEDILSYIFKEIVKIQKQNQITIKPLDNPENLTISKLIEILNEHFTTKYNTFGASKLPVLAFYSIYQILLKELSRYKDCELKELNSHTSSDKSSKSAGDIEIFKQNILFEAIEIKLDKEIDTHLLRIAKEKITKFNPTRYYILSNIDIKDKENIDGIIDEIKRNHGCQIVVNGLLPTLKYYFRLIEGLNEFVSIYSCLIEKDEEIKSTHKEKWNELLQRINI